MNAVGKRRKVKKLITEFTNTIRKNLLKSAILIISPQDEDISFAWAITKEKNVIKFSIEDKWLNLFSVERFMTNCIIEHLYLNVLFKNYTGEFLDQHEILELWGYKLLLVDQEIIVEPISSQKLFDYCSDVKVLNKSFVHPNPIHIYCGPDGRIFGKDLI